jgi:hypothetical protein
MKIEICLRLLLNIHPPGFFNDDDFAISRRQDMFIICCNGENRISKKLKD